MNIEQQIADYKPYNEQEAHDQAVMRQLLATQPDLFTRESGGAYDSVIVAVERHAR